MTESKEARQNDEPATGADDLFIIEQLEATGPAAASVHRKWMALATCATIAIGFVYWQWFQSLNTAEREIALWVIIVGALTNVACALLGCYLVLRRMSLLGDALSHAVLPGLIVAFILSGRVNIGVMFLGALAAGLLTTFFVQTLSRRGRMGADASMGVVFTSMFALGLILIKRYTGGGIDLDAGCVFMGALDFVSLGPRVEIAGLFFPRPFVSIAPVLFLNLVFILLLWKELKISSFDPALATSIGLSAGLMHYLLMGMVALTTVASFEAVGSVLVVAMLIVPAATAHLLTDRLAVMLWISGGLAVGASVLAYWFSYTFRVNTPGMMAVIVGLFYVVAVLVSPQYGVISKIVRNVTMSMRVVREDLLAMLYRLEEMAEAEAINARQAVQAVGGGWMARLSLRLLIRSGLIVVAPVGLRLTDSGRQRAEQLVRSHRLWETFLVERLGLPLDHVHDPAMRMEHFIDEDLQRKLVDDLPDPTTDPHGRDIPGQDE